MMSGVTPAGTSPPPSVWEGIGRFLDTYVGVVADDAVAIAYTPDSRLQTAWVIAALSERGISPVRVPMRPLVDSTFLERLTQALPAPESVQGRLVMLTFERDTMSHNDDLKAALTLYDADQCKVFRAISTSDELFTTAFALAPEELSARNTAVLERLQKAQHLHIETMGGSNLDVELDNSRFRWISNRGVWRSGKFVVVPAGEVATFPASITGTLVADFAVNVNTFLDQDVRLEMAPAFARIDAGRVADISCDNEDLQHFFERCLERPNARRVGELGFGTNAAVTTAIPMNSHTNERRPGVHIGFGQHNQREEVAGYFCDVHLDLIARGGRVWVDGEPEVLDLEGLLPSANPHPPIFVDEDVYSPELIEGDCCGVYRAPMADERRSL